MKKQIWMKVGNYEPTFLEFARNQADAEAKVRIYERQDRQELAEGYGFPHGMPEYFIK